MYSVSLDFHRALAAGRVPDLVAALDNAAGLRLYGTATPEPDAFGWTAPHLADGSHTADGSVSAGEGALPIVDRRPDLLAARMTETLTPDRSGLLASLQGQEAGQLRLTLKNAMEPDGLRHFSRLLAVENILGAGVTLRLVFPDLSGKADGLDRFQGRVLGFSLSEERLILDVGAV